ncbi:MAG: glycosyltransferase [Paludibacteraceae bacterium]|nr:glycosyltransferase [Paludibacteraceae bacterium]
MFLSIIIPCYNVASFLPRTIAGLKDLKDADDVEFIFINDGSADNTLQLIQHFAQDDARVRVINQDNQGVSTARNNALAIAKGDFLLCLDGDDFIESSTVATIRRYCQDCDILVAPVNIVTEQSSVKQTLNIPCGVYTVDEFFSQITIFPVTPKLIYRTECIRPQQLQFNPNVKSGEVLDFTFSVMAFANTIKVISTPFYNYFMRTSSATHAPNCTADLTSLLLVEHVRHIQQAWAQTPACLFTTYKMVNAFTYNKYLRLHVSTHDVLETLNTLLHTDAYRHLLLDVAQSSQTPLIERLFIAYQLLMPTRFGYRLLNGINRIIPFIR